MTFDQWRSPHLLHPPVWFVTAETRPPEGVWVLVRRDADSPPDVDRIVSVERVIETERGPVRRKAYYWCGSHFDGPCTGVAGLERWKFWASAEFLEV